MMMMKKIFRFMSEKEIKEWNSKVKRISKHLKYYVYAHYLDGELFYIGKGGYNNRCSDLTGRSKQWKDYVNGREKYVVVDIINAFDSEVEAITFEQDTIISLSGENLVNVIYNNKNKQEENVKEKFSFSSSEKTKVYFNRVVWENSFSHLSSLELDVLMVLLSKKKKERSYF